MDDSPQTETCDLCSAQVEAESHSADGHWSICDACNDSAPVEVREFLAGSGSNQAMAENWLRQRIERVVDAGDKREYVCGICGGFAEKEFCPCCGNEQSDEIYCQPT